MACGMWHVAAVSHLLAHAQPSFTSLNLGIRKGHSVREIFQAAKHVLGQDFTVTEAPRRAGDPATLVADVDTARAVLG